MDLRKIKKLIEMLQESDLNEIEVKEGEESVRINRKKGDVEIPQQIVAPQVQSKEIVENVDDPEENLSFILPSSSTIRLYKAFFELIILLNSSINFESLDISVSISSIP